MRMSVSKDENDHNVIITEMEISEKVEDRMRNSPFFKSNPPSPLPCYPKVEMGKILGQGEFGTVREVIGFPSDEENNVLQTALATYITDETEFDGVCSPDEDDDDCREPRYHAARQVDLGKRCWRNGKTRYAVKGLRDDLQDADQVHVGLIDLAMEANFLASLSHPNIIKIRGTLGVPGQLDFMLILDRLHLTLEDKLSRLWKIEQRRIHTSYFFGLRKKSFQIRQRDFMTERLVAAYDIARVFKYLHEHNIIYRDLKPANIGYNVRGDLRIFDFGLAKEVTKDDLLRVPEDFNCTGLVGTARWMAPEVYLCEPYGPSVDVYSFGLLLWNIFSLKIPFGQINPTKHYNSVILNEKRPANLKFLPKSLDIMMSHCWSADRGKRPSFRVICSILRYELRDFQDQLAAELHNELLDRTAHLEAKSACSVEC